MTDIHPTASIAPSAQIGAGCRIGPGCVIGEHAVLEDGVELMAHVIVDGRARLGAGMKVFPFATIGLAPQDLKYKGEPTGIEIGARTLVREHATLHRGSTGGDGMTRIGADCMIMVGVHIGHDCTLANNVILANNAMLGGHVEVGDTVFIGGASAIHQFVRIGRQVIVGGMSGVEADIVPYGSVMGNRARLHGLNLNGLKRRNFSRAQIHALRGAFRTLFGEPGVFQDRMRAVETRYAGDVAVGEVLAFLHAPSKRGLCKAARDLDLAEEADEAVE